MALQGPLLAEGPVPEVEAGDSVFRSDQVTSALDPSLQDGYWELARSFSVIGWTAFGGPTAHIARFHHSFVEIRGWLSDSIFAELLALCQMLPGPSSTQMSFALGILHRGPAGGLFSGLLFQYPGLVLLTLVGLGAAQVLVNPPAWLHAASAGLATVAVALVAEAALLLGSKLCRDVGTQLICCAAAAIAFAWQEQWLFPALILSGGLVSYCLSLRRQEALVAHDSSADDAVSRLGLSPSVGGALILIWLLILAAAVIGKNSIPYEAAPALHWFEAFYTTGSFSYGGGQVILPLLQHVVVKYDTICPPPSSPHDHPQCWQVESNSTWVTEQQFLAGLAVVQAMPGPLFNFSAYLGAIVGGVGGALVCWLGLFGPGVILVFGTLPFWSRFRSWNLYKKALPGLNSAAVGLIYASVFQLGLTTVRSSPFPTASVSIGMAGYGLAAFLKVPAPAAVLSGGLAGIGVWATTLLQH